MGKGSKNKTTQTQTSTSEPWSAAQPTLKTVLGNANSIAKNTANFQPYQGPTFVPYSLQTQEGMAGIYGASQAALPGLQNAYGTVSGISSGSGFNGPQDAALSQLQKIADGGQKINTDGLYADINFASNGSNAADNLARIARGDFLDGRSDPGFATILKRAQNDAANAVGLSASASGRYGSGIAQGNVAREVGDVTARALSDNYQTQMQRQLQASGMIDSQRNANLQTKLAAAQGMTGIQSQNIANQMSASGNLFNAGQQGIANRLQAASMLPSQFDATLDPYRAIMGVGSMNEDLAGRQLNDQIRLYEGNRDAPKNATEWLNAIAMGNGQLGKSTKEVASTPKANPFSAALGGAAGGYQLGGPIGGLIGGGAGLLGLL